MLKRDNIALGLLLGLVLPVLFYGLLWLLSLIVEANSPWARPFDPDKMPLVALVINLIPIRVYFVRYKFDKTGRGVLFITFLLMVAFFIYKKYS